MQVEWESLGNGAALAPERCWVMATIRIVESLALKTDLETLKKDWQAQISLRLTQDML